MILSLVFLASCQKDNEEFIPTNSSNITGNEIFGLVIDESDDPVEGALVSFDGQTVMTNKFGIYQFKDVTLNSRHNFINITKDGYFEGARTFRTNKKTTIQHTTQLLPKLFTNNFDGGTGGSVAQGNISLSFPAGAVVVESSGADFTGEVQVAIQYLDPTNDRVIRRMPGDMSARDADDVYSTLNSFGMAYVELQSTSGEKLQLKDGMTATMTGEIPAVLAENAPESIKMWVFDDATGLWKEEGSAQKVGNSYVGEVAHFSCWNYDGSAETVIACGRIVDEKGNPIGGVHVWIATVDIWGVGHGNTNPDGTFCGAVTKDELLTLEIRYIQGCDEPVFLGEIGPFNMDVDLGDIVITVDEQTNILVSGTAVNCDGDPLENGVLIFHNQSAQITDGSFNGSILQCNPDQDFKVRVIDLDALTESETFIVTGVGPHDLGQVSSCGTEIFSIGINIDDLDINEVALIEVFAFTDSIDIDPTKSVIGFVEDSQSGNGGGSIRMGYDDGSLVQGFELGTFPLTTLFYQEWGATTEDSYSLESGEITILHYNEAEGFLRGNYTAEVVRQSDGLTYTIYGNFKVNT